MASYYLVESYDASVEHNGRSSVGVLGDPLDRSIREKIYLHVVPLEDRELGTMGPRVDEDGNKQHGRLALPRNEAFWIAVDGEVAWPKIFAPRLVSKCALQGGAPRPVPLGPGELERLAKVGLVL